MSTVTAELVSVVEELPPEKQAAVADFARFLLARQGDEAWERILDMPKRRPRLEAFLQESASEADEPLNLGRL